MAWLSSARLEVEYAFMWFSAFAFINDVFPSSSSLFLFTFYLPFAIEYRFRFFGGKTIFIFFHPKIPYAILMNNKKKTTRVFEDLLIQYARDLKMTLIY